MSDHHRALSLADDEQYQKDLDAIEKDADLRNAQRKTLEGR